MQRSRSAALGLLLALMTTPGFASAQTSPPSSDSASKPAEQAPNLFRDIQANAFASFVVDRLTGPNGEERIYLRPKVPFGHG